jgi:large subunit ribosomal protein L20
MRVKTGFSRRRHHKKILKATRGYYGTRSKLYRKASEAFLHAGQYAFAGRKDRQGQCRRLWIERINAALTPWAVKYSVFMGRLKKAQIVLDRKILADLALHEPTAFKALVEKVV